MKRSASGGENLFEMKTSTPAGHWFLYRTTTESGCCFYAPSPVVSRLLGLPRDVETGEIMNLIPFVHPEDQPGVQAQFSAALRDEAPFHAECRVQHARRGNIWIELQAMPQREPEGDVLWHGLAQEITHRKLAEEARVRAERNESALRGQYAFLLDRTPFPAARLDEKGRVRYLNPAFEALTGLSGKESFGHPLSAWVSPRNVSVSFPELLQTAWGGASSPRVEAELPAASGMRCLCRLHFIPEFGQTGGIESVLAIAENITEFSQAKRTLEVRERTFRAVVENTPDIIVRYDRDGRRLYVNQGYMRATGLLARDLLGKTSKHISSLLPESAVRFQRLIQKVFRSGAPERVTLETRDMGKGNRWIDILLTPEFGPDGEVESVLSIGRDITAHKEAERLQHARKREFRTFIENAPDPMVRFDREGRRLYVNKAQMRLTGLPLDQQLGKTPAELSNLGEAVVPYMGYIKEAVATGVESRRVMEWTNPQGVHYWHEISFVPERGLDGEVESVLMVARDITALKEAERRLQARERESRTLVENSPDIIVRYDLDCRRLFVNKKFEELSGIPPEEVLGKPPLEKGIPGAPNVSLMAMLKDTAADGRSRERLFEFPDRHGATVYYSMRVVAEIDAEGRPESLLSFSRDITALKQAERDRHAREREFRTLVENSPDAIVRYDRNLRRLYVNKAHLTYTGLTFEETVGKTPMDGSILGPAIMSYLEAVKTVLATGVPRNHILEWKRADGAQFVHDFRFVPEFDHEGRVESVLSFGRDITDFTQAEKWMEQAEAIAHVGHWHCDLRRDSCYFSKEACRILGKPENWNPRSSGLLLLLPRRERKEVQQKLAKALASKAPEVVMEVNLGIDGHDVHLRGHARLEYDDAGMPLQIVGMLQDVSFIKSCQVKLHTMAYTDELTGLPNRVRLMETLQHAVADAATCDANLGFGLLDLDNFKTINDTHGHLLGDALLRAAGERLRRVLRPEDVVARLGGDEFALVLSGIRRCEDIRPIAQKIVEAFSLPFLVDGLELFVTCSLGMAMFPDDGRDATELLRSADSAMYHAKARGRRNYQFYSSELTTRMKERAAIEGALRQALGNGELLLHFQPQIDLRGGRLVGAEALLRWNHPEMGMVPPMRFIGIAEETGIIGDIGLFVLRTACRAASMLNSGRARALRLAVNVSPRQFSEADFLDSVRRILLETGCRGEWIELEITESLLLENREERRKILESFQATGMTIAIDDFGTGFSALSYLTSFPVDTIKIDRSFINEITTNPDRAELVNVIISMGRALRCSIVAEGIETPEQEAHLKASGCRFAQGYLYGKPMPLEEFQTLLR